MCDQIIINRINFTDMEEKNLNSKESLDLIAQMIQATKSKLEKGGSVYILVWGYISLLTTIAVYAALTLTHDPHYNWLWFAIPVIGAPVMAFFKGKNQKRVTTYIDRIINYVWIVIGGVIMTVPIVALFLHFRFPILMIIGTLVSIGVILTGLIIQFRTFWICGILSIGLSFCTLFIDGMDQIIIYGIMIIVCMVVPGHILKLKESRR